ncbi:MAG: hypothetical protein J3K34DRAFT_226728 [Monoraphidium minutum]|nr:MAG: hypothetical protein J3K34DRAFT_226728 [Monoraphidium minutum]
MVSSLAWHNGSLLIGTQALVQRLDLAAGTITTITTISGSGVAGYAGAAAAAAAAGGHAHARRRWEAGPHAALLAGCMWQACGRCLLRMLHTWGCGAVHKEPLPCALAHPSACSPAPWPHPNFTRVSTSCSSPSHHCCLPSTPTNSSVITRPSSNPEAATLPCAPVPCRR